MAQPPTQPRAHGARHSRGGDTARTAHEEKGGKDTNMATRAEARMAEASRAHGEAQMATQMAREAHKEAQMASREATEDRREAIASQDKAQIAEANARHAEANKALAEAHEALRKAEDAEREALAEWRDAKEEAQREIEETARVSEEPTEEATETTEDTEVVELDQDTYRRALIGAQRCINHWADEHEDELRAEAEARYWRIVHGTAPMFEVEGALDWLDDQPTDPLADAIEYITQYWGAEEVAQWLEVNEGEEALAVAGTLLKWADMADAEGEEPVPDALVAWANEVMGA